MKLWQPTPAALWQGRDDSAEAANALRLFQTIVRAERFEPEMLAGDIALLGFACDEGVRRNKGRTGAERGPETLRRALANMASHDGHDRCVDMGTIHVADDALEAAQQALREAVTACQRAGKRTLVLGGGHETAFGHGAGVLDAFPGEEVGIINLDAHLDLRIADRASSGTPFRQLALACEAQRRAFHYACIGVSRAANTQALLDEAARRGVTIIEDLDVLNAFEARAIPELARNIARYDRLYLTIDLDVLPRAKCPPSPRLPRSASRWPRCCASSSRCAAAVSSRRWIWWSLTRSTILIAREPARQRVWRGKSPIGGSSDSVYSGRFAPIRTRKPGHVLIATSFRACAFL